MKALPILKSFIKTNSPTSWHSQGAVGILVLACQIGHPTQTDICSPRLETKENFFTLHKSELSGHNQDNKKNNGYAWRRNTF